MTLLHDQIRAHLAVGPLRFHDLLARVPATGVELSDALEHLQEAGHVVHDGPALPWRLTTTATTDAHRDVKPGNAEPDAAPTTTATTRPGGTNAHPEDTRGSLWTTPTAPGAGGLPASKIPGLEDEIRILTLDDVAEPVPTSPVPPRGHPAHGVGPSWSERIAALEEALGSMEHRIGLAFASYREPLKALEGDAEEFRSQGVRLHERIDGLTTRLHRLEHPEPAGPVAAPLGIHVEAKREREAVVAFLRRWGHHTAADRIEDAQHLAKATP